MSAPTTVNGGTYTTTASGTSIAPPLPGSRVNNNLLIAYIQVKATGKTIGITGTGWSAAVDSINSANTSGAYFWRLVDGTETAPTLSWTGAAAAAGQVLQFTANKTTSPIGAKNKATAAASTTATVAGITTTAVNSLIMNLIQTSNSQTIPTPSPYTVFPLAANANGSVMGSTGPAYQSGTTSQAVSVAVTSSDWTSFGFEILGTGTITAGEPVRSSQVVQQILEQYSDLTKTIASQTVLQVLRVSNTGYFDSVSETISLADTDSAVNKAGATIAESISLADTESITHSANATIAETMTLADLESALRKTFASAAEALSLLDTDSASQSSNASVIEDMELSDSTDFSGGGGIVLTPPLVLRDDYLYNGLPNYFDPANAIARVDLNLDKLRKFPGKN